MSDTNEPNEPIDLGRRRRDLDLSSIVPEMREVMASGDSAGLDAVMQKISKLVQGSINRVQKKSLSPAEERVLSAINVATKKIAKQLPALSAQMRVSVAHMLASLSSLALEIENGPLPYNLSGDAFRVALPFPGVEQP